MMRYRKYSLISLLSIGMMLALNISVQAGIFGTLYDGYALWKEKQQVDFELYKWAWYHIIPQDRFYYEKEVFRAEDGCKLTLHYCGPGKMMEICPCKGDRLALPCYVSYGFDPRAPMSEEIYLLRGRLPNQQYFIDPSLSCEWWKRKRRQDPRAMCIGLGGGLGDTSEKANTNTILMNGQEH